MWGGDRQLVNGRLAPNWVIPVCSAVVFAALLLRRRFPLAVFAGQVGFATAATVIVPLYNPFIGVLVALHALASRRERRRSIPALVACSVPFGLQSYDAVGHVVGSRLFVVGTLSVLPAVAAWGLGHRTWLADRHVEQLEAQRDATANEAVRLERLRIARELHDILAHSVSVMVLHAAGAQAVFSSDPERARDAFRVIQDAGVGCMGELRRLLYLLRVAGEDSVDELGHPPRLADLGGLGESAGAAGVVVTREVDGAPGRLDSSVDLTAYRVVQEALTNTIKHAGAGATVRVHLAWSTDRLTVTVEDRAGNTRPPASGTDCLSTGHGLRGLRERVAIAGGTFDAHPIGGGFVVRAVLPLHQQLSSADRGADPRI
jgi:signal transduction histidine kinase